MIYDIRHVTTYSYESPVNFARCSLRLEPKSGDGQQLISHSVEIRPRPADRAVRRDFFGTHTESILIETAHRNLRVDSRSRVSVSRKAFDRAAPSPSWEDIRDVAFEATSQGPVSPVGYVFASSLVPVLAPVTAYAVASFPPGGGIVSGAADLMRRIGRATSREVLVPRMERAGLHLPSDAENTRVTLDTAAARRSP